MPILPIVYGILNSRIANILAALLVGFGYGWWKTDAGWRAYEAKQQEAWKVIHQMEMVREAKNAEEIAKAATRRAEEDAVELSELRRQIAEFDRGEANAKTPCVIDDAFRDAAGRLRARPAPPHRARVTRPPK